MKTNKYSKIIQLTLFTLMLTLTAIVLLSENSNANEITCSQPVSSQPSRDISSVNTKKSCLTTMLLYIPSNTQNKEPEDYFEITFSNGKLTQEIHIRTAKKVVIRKCSITIPKVIISEIERLLSQKKSCERVEIIGDENKNLKMSVIQKGDILELDDLIDSLYPIDDSIENCDQFSIPTSEY